MFLNTSTSPTTINIIYYGIIGSTNTIKYCNLNNNLAYGISTNIVIGSNSGSGNINADPKFAYKYTGNSYNDLDNYHLQATSPIIPVMQELIIQNALVPANGNLNFSVKAYKTTK